jgi:hypothetical protein
MRKSRNVPGPSEAVHLVERGSRSVCGQSMKGEQELPQGSQITCPVCTEKGSSR